MTFSNCKGANKNIQNKDSVYPTIKLKVLKFTCI